MTEKINWHKELLESRKFNNKISKSLLDYGAKNFMQGIYLGYMYSRWRKIRGLDKDCLLYTSPSPRDRYISRMPSSA